MTEADWLAATDPAPMLGFIRPKLGVRKERLFHVACCRHVWPRLPADGSRRAVEAAELHADGLISDDDLEAAANDACHVWDLVFEQLPTHERTMWTATGYLDPPIVTGAAYNVAAPMDWWGGAPAFDEPARIIRNARDVPSGQGPAQCDLLRDVVGNPFRPVVLDPSWRTEAVVALAAGIYADRAFERMPVLADALDDAGCADADILSHCRGDGPHVRGCWVVDLLLGKA